MKFLKVNGLNLKYPFRHDNMCHTAIKTSGKISVMQGARSSNPERQGYRPGSGGKFVKN